MTVKLQGLDNMLLGIDPGVNNCGLAVVDTAEQFKVLLTHNIKNARKFTDEEKAVELAYNARVVKVQAIVKKVADVLDEYTAIDFIAMEAPFYHHLTPQAYGSLLEVISAIKYNILIPRALPYRMLEPMLVKKLFANKGMAKKEIVKQFLLSRMQAGEITLPTPIDDLSEHEVDAVAVAFVHQLSVTQEGVKP